MRIDVAVVVVDLALVRGPRHDRPVGLLASYCRMGSWVFRVRGMRVLTEKTIAPARRPGIEVECLIQETRADMSERTNRERSS